MANLMIPKTATALLACLAAAVPGLAQHGPPSGGSPPAPPSGEGQPATPSDAAAPVTLSSGRTLHLFPAHDLYPVYIADPHRTTNGVYASFYTKTSIAQSSDVRAVLLAGGRFGILRIDPAEPGGRSWQFSIDAGLDAQFDSYNKLDNIGWDGNYGFTLTTATGGPFSFKLGILHCSAHVGDEYEERTGRLRIDYTREEAFFGVARRTARWFRAYADVAVATHQVTEEQRPWRMQGGLEYESRPRLFGGRFWWYAALDLQSWQERDWRVDTSMRTGVATKGVGRTWRFGIGFADGRPPIGEFFQDTEAHFFVGMWVDP
jgi:Protein of unknown function (DUF1207)